MQVALTSSTYSMAMVRWNGLSRRLEAMDTSGNWYVIDFEAVAPPELFSALQWVEQERNRQTKISQLRNKYPALNTILEQAEVIQSICEANESSNQSSVP